MTTPPPSPPPHDDAPTNPGGPGGTPSPSSGPGVSTRLFDADVADPMPGAIGAYRVVRELGRGGMGVVYLAVKGADAFHQRVAIKVVKRGMDSDEILRRFNLERQVLAALNHPNIARLLDAGATDDGRSYFVLEYIEGQPIDAYCDANSLSVVDRLKLFQKVCGAVHYAHQNLVVHRDLKPQNIIVTPTGEPKLLDFGIAKLINPQLMQVTLATGPGIRLMTPEYASPEQVMGQPVNTSSDVYSLGVLLYELLTGHRPYHFRTRVEREIVRVICEVEPERPSTVVTRVEQIATSHGEPRTITPEIVSRTREGDPTRLRRRLSGDVDDIILKAMEKAAPRRYGSAASLSDDIQRHLEGMPVAASRARRDPLYNLSKFVRRHRRFAGAAGAVAAAILLGLVVALWQWSAAENARSRAVESAALAERAFLATPGLAELLTLSLESYKPAEAEARIDELQAVAADLDASDDPEIAYALARTLELLSDALGGKRGPSYNDPPSALRAASLALDIRKRLAGGPADSPERKARLAWTYLRVVDAQHDLDRSAEARALLDEALAYTRSADLPSYEVSVLSAIIRIESAAGDYAAAARTTQGLVATRERLDREQRTETSRRNLAVSNQDLGEYALAAGDIDTARAAFERSLRIRRDLLAAAPESARYKGDVAVALLSGQAALARKEDRHADAARHCREAIELLQAVAAAEPNDARVAMRLARARTDLASTLKQIDAQQEARDSLSLAIAELDRLLAAQPDDADLIRIRAVAWLHTGDLDEALSSADRRAAYGRAVGDYQRLCGRATPASRDVAALETARQRLAALNASAAQ